MDNASSGPNIKDCAECNNPRSCHNPEQGCGNPQHGQYHVAYAHARRYMEAHPEAAQIIGRVRMFDLRKRIDK